MTVVLDEIGDGHAVLTVRTDRGDLILDNKTYAVKRWDETGYSFIKREAETATGWAFVEDPPAKVAAADSRGRFRLSPRVAFRVAPAICAT